jgi:enhancing lycopene biosynthesis protein 2
VVLSGCMCTVQVQVQAQARTATTTLRPHHYLCTAPYRVGPVVVARSTTTTKTYTGSLRFLRC